MKTDFIVIGSGLAGLTSSLILSKYGKVLLVTKGKLSDGSTNWAQGGIACAISGKDNWHKHAKDTLIAGAYHNDKKAVELLVKSAPAAIEWLSKQGVPFEKINGIYKVGKEGGHSFNRIIHATDFTGKQIELFLTGNIKKNKNINILEHAFAKKLLVKDKECYGLQIIKGNKVLNCFSRLTVLSTGGLGQIYKWTTNPTVSTGDGFALAHQAGAKLMDMEFIQFHPTALKPASLAGKFGNSPLFLLSEALRGEGAYLVKIKNSRLSGIHDAVMRNKLQTASGQITKNKINGERFMRDYDERLELAPRDIVARAIFDEQQNGFDIYLDIRHKGKDFLKKRFPNIYIALKKRGFDLSSDLIPVTPAAHFSCGGVKTDLYGRTNIKNLFAFGEVACTGVHGANRLASNSLLEAVVFPLRLLKSGSCRESIPNTSSKSSRQAGLKASEADDWNPSFSSPAILNNINKIRKNLQKLMWEKVGIIRRKQDLEVAKEKVEEWQKRLNKYDGLDIEILELKDMVETARLIVLGALNRAVSLGAHQAADL